MVFIKREDFQRKIFANSLQAIAIFAIAPAISNNVKTLTYVKAFHLYYSIVFYSY